MVDRAERKRIRIRDFDYSQQGAYFITICACDRKPIFGHVIAGDVFHLPYVELSPVGQKVQYNIRRIPEVYQNVLIDKFVVMPNHVHLLIQVNEEKCVGDPKRDKMLIPKIIQSFKASVSKSVPAECRPVWQSRYFDHVIRNEQDYLRIWEYIHNNEAKWMEDKYYIN